MNDNDSGKQLIAGFRRCNWLKSTVNEKNLYAQR